MRKPRDFDSELKALADKAKQLKERRVQQLGELVIATGADATDAETLAGALLVIAETSEAQRRRRGASAARPSFKARRASVAAELKASRTALSRLTAARHRLEAAKARTDMREWQVKRRERTRQLIELGGLVVKAGLVELADDDRATLYGAFLTVAAKLRGEEREQALVLWKRKGKRAFEAGH
jgi:hypothetical protein